MSWYQDFGGEERKIADRDLPALVGLRGEPCNGCGGWRLARMPESLEIDGVEIAAQAQRAKVSEGASSSHSRSPPKIIFGLGVLFLHGRRSQPPRHPHQRHPRGDRPRDAGAPVVVIVDMDGQPSAPELEHREVFVQQHWIGPQHCPLPRSARLQTGDEVETIGDRPNPLAHRGFLPARRDGIGSAGRAPPLRIRSQALIGSATARLASGSELSFRPIRPHVRAQTRARRDDITFANRGQLLR
jgi:hypothetical protein